MSQVGDSKERTYKSVLFEVLPEAIEAERSPTGRLDARGLFYACRRLYLNHADRPRGREARYASQKKNPEYILDYDYFNNKVLPGYEREYGEIPGLVRSSRGHLYAPHVANDTEELATEFVADFLPPDYYYDKVLYVEKHGIAQGLVDLGLGRRYDMAIVASQGYATEADRKLLQLLDDEDYQVFVLHDCDIDGYGIVNAVGDGNERMPDLDVDVLDIGMSLEDARALAQVVPSFLGEEATRQKAIPEATAALLADDELRMFTGTPKPNKQGVWLYHRYELNEIPSDRRLPFVEAKLRQAGVRPKVTPPEAYLREKSEEMVREDFAYEVREAILRAVGSDEIVERHLPDFLDRYGIDNAREWIEAAFARPSQRSWRGVVRGKVQGQGTEFRPEIEDAVRRSLDGE